MANLAEVAAPDIVDEITDILERRISDPREMNRVLRELVHRKYVRPEWSNLEGARIKVAEEASFSMGAALVFEENGRIKVVMLEAGDHYDKQRHGRTGKLFMIPGGFGNLMKTKGGRFIRPSGAPEHAAIAMSREIAEELRRTNKKPLLPIHPSRVKLMDSLTLAFGNGAKCVVMGGMVELKDREVRMLKRHVERLASDPAYKAAVVAHTKNAEFEKPEVAGVEIFDLSDVGTARCPLLHEDQTSLFQKINGHFVERERIIKLGMRRALAHLKA